MGDTDPPHCVLTAYGHPLLYQNNAFVQARVFSSLTILNFAIRSQTWTWLVMPQSSERLLINKCLHPSRDYFNMFTLSAPVAVKCFLRLLSDCFPSLARHVGLNTSPGKLSTFIQTKMLCKLRCREETLLSFSMNRLFKQTLMEILLLCRGRIISKMRSAPPYLYWACHSRADFWACLVFGLVPGLFKWGGTRS